MPRLYGIVGYNYIGIMYICRIMQKIVRWSKLK